MYWNGDFREGLLDPASVVTDLKDTLLCPTENIVSSLVNSFASELGFKVHSTMDIQSVDWWTTELFTDSLWNDLAIAYQ